VLYALDDGTGLIQCVKFFSVENGPNSYPEDDSMGVNSSLEFLPLGTLVRVRATLTRYHGTTELKVVGDLTDLSRDPNAETLHWLDAVDLATSVYHQPLLHDATTVSAVRARDLHTAPCVCSGGGRIYWEETGVDTPLESAAQQVSFTTTRAELQYCFCTATADERRDPGLTFRMELLAYLARAARGSSCVLQVAYADLVKACGSADPTPLPPPLRTSSSLSSSSPSSSEPFEVDTTAHSNRLAEVAYRVATATAPKPAPTASVSTAASSAPIPERQRVRTLLRMTLAALRQDGLLFHDPNTDSDYFLDSEHFLVPLLEACLEDFEATYLPPKAADSLSHGEGPSQELKFASLSSVPTVDGLRTLAAARDPRIGCIPDSRIKLCLEDVERRRALDT